MNERKKILIFVDWFEPGYKAGGPIQSCKNFVKVFQEEFDLYIITSDRDLGEIVPYENIATDQWLTYDKKVKIYYASGKSLHFSNILKLISFVKPDYIHLNNMYSLNFTILPLLIKQFKNISAQIVLSPRGMLQEGAILFKPFKKRFFLKLLNLIKIPGKIIFHATDEQEQSDIKKYFPQAKQIFIAGNFGADVVFEWRSIAKTPGKLKLIFLSRISPKKNLLHTLRLFHDYEFEGDILFDIAGSIEDKAYWEECKSLMRNLPSNIVISYIGSISNAEIYEKFSDYHIFILPTLGENFGHAIFEALLSGRPVIVSDRTPWRNLAEKKTGFDISLSDPSAFQQAIQKFASMEQDEYDMWSRAAWQFSKDYTLRNNTKEKYRQIFIN